MELFAVLGIAVGLAMDAFAVALATSVSLPGVTRRQVFRFGFHFGLFQAMMPTIGWLAGRSIQPYIERWDHWAAFVILAAIGGKAVYEAVWGDDDEAQGDPTRGWSLVALSVATSIDALAVGLSFAMLRMAIWYPAVVIGVVTAFLTTFGMLMGTRLGGRFGQRMEVLGGLVLIGIGIKIVMQHG
jgi:manganese efflux pump family protein